MRDDVSFSAGNASTQKNAIEAGWTEMTSPVSAERGDCIVLGDSDLFDVEPLR